MSEIRSFSTKGKILLLLNFVTLIAIMLVAAIFYSILPESVPTHYDFAGNPTSYGDKFTFIATVSLASIAAPSIIILLSLLRFRLIERYPYLINLPAFMLLLRNLPKEKIYAAINEIFEVILLVGFVLGLGILFLVCFAFESALNPEIPKLMGYFVLVFVLVVFATVFAAMYMYKRIYDKFKKSIK